MYLEFVLMDKLLNIHRTLDFDRHFDIVENESYPHECESRNERDNEVDWHDNESIEVTTKTMNWKHKQEIAEVELNLNEKVK